MYKYSRLAQDRFLSIPQFAFLFIFFAKSAKAQQFAVAKFRENRDKDFPGRMQAEIESLCGEAYLTLGKSQQSVNKPLREYLQRM